MDAMNLPFYRWVGAARGGSGVAHASFRVAPGRFRSLCGSLRTAGRVSRVARAGFRRARRAFGLAGLTLRLPGLSLRVARGRGMARHSRSRFSPFPVQFMSLKPLKERELEYARLCSARRS